MSQQPMQQVSEASPNKQDLSMASGSSSQPSQQPSSDHESDLESEGSYEHSSQASSSGAEELRLAEERELHAEIKADRKEQKARLAESERCFLEVKDLCETIIARANATAGASLSMTDLPLPDADVKTKADEIFASIRNDPNDDAAVLQLYQAAPWAAEHSWIKGSRQYIRHVKREARHWQEWTWRRYEEDLETCEEAWEKRMYEARRLLPPVKAGTRAAPHLEAELEKSTEWLEAYVKEHGVQDKLNEKDEGTQE